MTVKSGDMLNAVFRQVRCRVTWLRTVVCLNVVLYTYIVLFIYLQPSRPCPPVFDRRPLASFVHRPAAAAVSPHSRRKIPKIIHQTWKSRSDLPETFRTWMSSWLEHNADWQYWLWTDADIRLLIAAVFPQYLSLFDSYPAQGYRVDVFR